MEPRVRSRSRSRTRGRSTCRRNLERVEDALLPRVSSGLVMWVAVPQWRTFTVQGPQVVLSMLHGHKPVETRKRKHWPNGWYFVHIGCQPTSHECARVLHLLWPTAPPEATLQRRGIYGLVRIHSVIPVCDVMHPWALASFGQWSYILQETLTFREPILGIRGQQGVWYVRDGQVREYLARALRSAVHRTVQQSQIRT